jgi:hypothetical protein
LRLEVEGAHDGVSRPGRAHALPVGFSRHRDPLIKEERMRTALYPVAAFVVLAAATVPGCGHHASITSPDSPRDASARSVRSGATGADLAATSVTPLAPRHERFPPRVTITSPQPDPFLETVIPSTTFTLEWSVVDPDGPGSDPKSFRYFVLSENYSEDYSLALQDPDALMRKHAPRFEGWLSVDGRLRSTVLANLVPRTPYLLVLTAIDKRGDYDAELSLDRNMLRFSVTDAGSAARVGADANPVNGNSSHSPVTTEEERER